LLCCRPSLLPSESADARILSFLSFALPLRMALARASISLLCFSWLSSASYWFIHGHHFSHAFSTWNMAFYRAKHIYTILLTPIGSPWAAYLLLPLPLFIPFPSRFGYFYTLKMKAVFSSETLVTIDKVRARCISQTVMLISRTGKRCMLLKASMWSDNVAYNSYRLWTLTMGLAAIDTRACASTSWSVCSPCHTGSLRKIRTCLSHSGSAFIPSPWKICLSPENTRHTSVSVACKPQVH
jgi:hypothetical protein